MKNKNFKAFSVVCIIAVIVAFATACGPGCKAPGTPAQWSNEYLQSCDFSLSNVTEVVLIYGCPPATFSIKKGQSEQDDEAISQVLEFWNAFQQQAVFNNDIFGEDHAVVGGGIKIKCVFADGTYIQIGKDSCTNFVVNDYGPCQLDNRDVYGDFVGIIEIMRKAKYLTDYYGDVPPYAPID